MGQHEGGASLTKRELASWIGIGLILAAVIGALMAQCGPTRLPVHRMDSPSVRGKATFEVGPVTGSQALVKVTLKAKLKELKVNKPEDAVQFRMGAGRAGYELEDVPTLRPIPDERNWAPATVTAGSDGVYTFVCSTYVPLLVADGGGSPVPQVVWAQLKVGPSEEPTYLERRDPLYYPVQLDEFRTYNPDD